MNNAIINESLYTRLKDEVKSIHNLLDTLQKSDVLIDYFDKYVQFYTYSNFILLFFYSLRRDNIIKLELPSGNIKQIKSHYDKIYKQVITTNKILTFENLQLINSEYYENFKNDLKNNFPKFYKLITNIEKQNNYSKIVLFLLKEKKSLHEYVNENKNLLSLLSTKKLEFAVRKGKLVLNRKEETSFFNSVNVIVKQCIKYGVDNLDESADSTLKEYDDIERDFNDRLHKRWKKPLDLLKLLIISSSEIGVEKIKFFGKNIRIEK